MNSRLKFRYLFWLAALLLIWWAVRDVNLVDVRETLIHLTWGQIVLLVSLNVVILLLFSSRWWLILRALGYNVSYLTLAGYRLAAFGVSYFTPGPQFGGEPLQVHLLHARHGVPISTALAAVTLDKLFELLANFSFLLAGASISLSVGTGSGLWLILGLALLPPLYLLALRTGRSPLTWLAGRLLSLGRWISPLRQVYQTIGPAEARMVSFTRQHSKVMVQALFLSGLTWVALIVEYRTVLYFLDARLDWRGVITVMTAARLAFLAPTPGGLGTLEAALVFAMQGLGLNPALGISLVLLTRVRDVLLGGLGLWWSSVVLRKRSVLGPNINSQTS